MKRGLWKEYTCLYLIEVNRPPSCRKNAVSIFLWWFAKWAGWEELPCPVLCSRLWCGSHHQAQLSSCLEMLRCSWQWCPGKTLFTQIRPGSSLWKQNFQVRNKSDCFKSLHVFLCPFPFKLKHTSWSSVVLGNGNLKEWWGGVEKYRWRKR